MPRFGSSRFETFLLYRFPLVFYVGLIFGLSSLQIDNTLGGIEIPDKLFHAAEYSLLPVLFFRFLVFTGPRIFLRYYFWVGIFLAAAVAQADEFYQFFVPGRTTDFFDFLADATGIGLAAIGWFIWRWRRKRN